MHGAALSVGIVCRRLKSCGYALGYWNGSSQWKMAAKRLYCLPPEPSSIYSLRPSRNYDSATSVIGRTITRCKRIDRFSEKSLSDYAQERNYPICPTRMPLTEVYCPILLTSGFKAEGEPPSTPGSVLEEGSRTYTAWLGVTPSSKRQGRGGSSYGTLEGQPSGHQLVGCRPKAFEDCLHGPDETFYQRSMLSLAC